MAASSTLFLIICSNTKRLGGRLGYEPAAALADRVKPLYKSALLEARQTVLKYIKISSDPRDDLMLVEFPRNEKLVAGPDLHGSESSGLYLPSAERYYGSFYRAMGANAAQLLMGTPHHVLILSGLYGLLLPGELIQDYRCHVEDHEAIAPTWKDMGRLTDILADYVTQKRITTVIDLTALSVYRDLINWNRLSQKAPGVQVRHAFGRQSVGDGLLTPLGELLGRWLSGAADTELNQVVAGNRRNVDTTTERVSFLDQDHPTDGMPREVPALNQRAARKDEIVRMARCLKYLLAAEVHDPDMADPGQVIKGLFGRETNQHPTARAMYFILNRRNKVEHNSWYTAPTDDLDAVRTAFRDVRIWAEETGRLKHHFSECDSR